MFLAVLLAIVVALNLGLWWYRRSNQLERDRDGQEGDVSLGGIAAGLGAQQAGGPDQRVNREDTEPIKFDL
jgi:hypothetical protein